MTIKHKYVYVGRLVFKMYPEIAEGIMNQYIESEPILNNYDDIGVILNIFRECVNENFPNNTAGISQEDFTYIKIKFINVCLLCYDPEASGPTNKKIKDGLRESIAKSINVNPSSVSQYIHKIKVYQKVYDDFRKDVEALFSMVILINPSKKPYENRFRYVVTEFKKDLDNWKKHREQYFNNIENL